MSRGDTRQRILDVALRLFADRGYAGTSIRDIAEELEVTKAAVHYHFPSKEQIVVALLEPFVGRFTALVDGLAPGPVDARTLLLAQREILDDGNPLLSAVSGDPSIAAACGPLHEQAHEMGARMAGVLVGPGASRADLLRAHTCLGAFFAGYEAALKLGGQVTDDDVEVVLTAALRTLD
jgi:AcrR family transcriptional regulator